MNSQLTANWEATSRAGYGLDFIPSASHPPPALQHARHPSPGLVQLVPCTRFPFTTLHLSFSREALGYENRPSDRDDPHRSPSGIRT